MSDSCKDEKTAPESDRNNCNGPPKAATASPSPSPETSCLATATQATSTSATAATVSIQPTSSDTTPITINTPRLYIGNLHPRVTAVHLESLLTKRGLAVTETGITLLHKPGASPSSSSSSSHSYAFCTLASVADARRARQLLHGRTLLGRTLVVQPAHAKAPSQAAIRGTSVANSTHTSNPTSTKRQLDQQIQAIRQKLREGESKKLE